MKRKFLIVFLPLILTACKSNDGVWYNTSLSANSFERDSADCQNSAHRDGNVEYSLFMPVMDAAMQSAMNKQELFSTCMRAKGYAYLNGKEYELQTQRLDNLNKRLNTYNKVERESGESQYNGKVKSINEYLKYDNIFEQPRLWLAGIHLDNNEYEKAIQAANFKATNIEVYKGLKIVQAVSYSNQGHFDLAQAVMDSVPHYLVEKDAGLLSIFSFLALEREDYELGLAYANKGTLIAPDRLSLKKNRGLAYVGLGQVRKGLALLNEVIQQDAKTGLYYKARGDAYLLLGDKIKAAADFQKACELKEKFACFELEKSVKV